MARRPFDRRRFLQQGVLGTSLLGRGWLSAGAASLCALSSRHAAASPKYGPLRPDPQGAIDLPEGFEYRVLQRVGELMTDGNPVRSIFDGMASFALGDGRIALLRNHELDYGGGGVSRLVLDSDYNLSSSNEVLLGTSRNCAGGPSPWGWLSCEEIPFGGVWVCPADADAAIPLDQRVRVDGYGSFRHEAVAIDPLTLTAYLTEDQIVSSLFRFVPDDPLTPFVGRLEAMVRPGKPGFDTASMCVGETIEVAWAPISDPANAAALAIAARACVFGRGEGIWWSDGAAFFTATSYNEVFALRPTADGGELTLLTRSLDMPDNITVAPSGELYVAEDNSSANHIQLVAGDGSVSPFAKSRLDPTHEFAGVCFSPDGKAMFANVQRTDWTLVITGPFATHTERDSIEQADAGVSASTPCPSAEHTEPQRVPEPAPRFPLPATPVGAYSTNIGQTSCATSGESNDRLALLGVAGAAAALAARRGGSTESED